MPLIVSDVHTGDRDTQREDAELRMGMSEVMAFLDYARRECLDVVEAGDAINYPPALWRSLMKDRLVWRARMLADVSIIPGNHDPLYGPCELGYEYGPVVEIGDCLVCHGHQFDDFWRDRNGGIGTRLRRWLGHEAIALAECVPDRWDDAAMIAAHKVQRLMSPKGARLNRVTFARRAASFARERGKRIIVCGHLHELWDVTIEGVRVICLGSWVPAGRWPGTFRAGVYDTDEHVLYEWRNGLMPWEEAS